MTQPQTAHRLCLEERRKLTLTGVTEVRSFDETLVALATGLGNLNIHGRELQLKDLSLEEGRAAVEGQISALIFEEPRQRSRLGRLFG